MSGSSICWRVAWLTGSGPADVLMRSLSSTCSMKVDRGHSDLMGVSTGCLVLMACVVLGENVPVPSSMGCERDVTCGITGAIRSGQGRVGTGDLVDDTVKNGFSDPNKEKEGQDRPRKDVMNRHQAKALREGCCERKEARTCVSSREKMNTNWSLARVITKSKSETQTVSNGHVSQGGRDGGFKEHPNIRDLIE